MSAVMKMPYSENGGLADPKTRGEGRSWEGLGPAPEGQSVALITIGQSPRVDIVPSMLPLLGVEHVREVGLLDGLNRDQLSTLTPVTEDSTLITRLRDGSSVKVDKDKIYELLQQAVHQLEQSGVDIMLILCTGDFAHIRSSALVLEPERILAEGVKSIAFRRRVGVIVPHADQISSARSRWSAAAVDVVVEAGSPYDPTPDERRVAAERLRQKGVDLVVLDCMGFTGEMKSDLRAYSGVPVIAANELVARVVGALL